MNQECKAVTFIVICLIILTNCAGPAYGDNIYIGVETGPTHLFNNFPHFLPYNHQVFADSNYFYSQMRSCGIDYTWAFDIPEDGVNGPYGLLSHRSALRDSELKIYIKPYDYLNEGGRYLNASLAWKAEKTDIFEYVGHKDFFGGEDGTRFQGNSCTESQDLDDGV